MFFTQPATQAAFFPSMHDVLQNRTGGGGGRRTAETAATEEAGGEVSLGAL